MEDINCFLYFVRLTLPVNTARDYRPCSFSRFSGTFGKNSVCTRCQSLGHQFYLRLYLDHSEQAPSRRRLQVVYQSQTPLLVETISEKEGVLLVVLVLGLDVLKVLVESGKVASIFLASGGRGPALRA
ncbi:uncharacterized protein OCT59_000343 [Rhizophagus irregularis]|uniref:uncharacterized protein n=1 Tax=Rhizophagus irregularis TaxID=588596 RepID=UPI00332DCEB7|nr:hypothetical protein OCT59_000343 [Rhizophagus irregularis]